MTFKKVSSVFPRFFRMVRIRRAATCILLLSFPFINMGCMQNVMTSGALSSGTSFSKLVDSSTPDTLSPQQSSLACLKTAEQLDGQNHVREAIQLYERARGFDPKAKGVSRRLAVLYAKSNNTSQAKKEFENALTESPKDSDLKCDFGYFLMQSGDYDEAEKAFLESLKLAPRHTKSKVHLAMLRAKQERFDDSFQLFSESVGPASAHSNVGVLLAKAGKQEEAIVHFDEATKLDPTLPAPKAFLQYFAKNSESDVRR